MTGTVEHVSGDGSAPLVGHRVVLHSVTLESGQPIDSSQTDRAGRYALFAEPVDTTATYLVSVEYDDIGYFSRPLVPVGRSVDSASTLTVYDTSYTQPRVFTGDRNTIVRAARSDGSRRVIELFTLKNGGKFTRIAADTSTPVWQAALPLQAMQLEIGDSDVSPDAIYLRDGSIAVAAPIPPGQKQILLSYLLPRGAREVPITMVGYVDRMHILLEDSTATVTGADFRFIGVDEIAESSYRRFSDGGLDADTVVTILLPPPPFSPQQLQWIIVLFVAAALATVLFLWMRKRSKPKTRVDGTGSDALAAQIALLDSEFEAKGEASERERTDYEQRRTALKQQLNAALAKEGGGR